MSDREAVILHARKMLAAPMSYTCTWDWQQALSAVLDELSVRDGTDFESWLNGLVYTAYLEGMPPGAREHILKCVHGLRSQLVTGDGTPGPAREAAPSDRAWDIAECRKALDHAAGTTLGFRISRERMEALIAEIDELTATRDTWREVAQAREVDYGKVAGQLDAQASGDSGGPREAVTTEDCAEAARVIRLYSHAGFRSEPQRKKWEALANRIESGIRAELGRAGTAQPTDVERKQMAVMLYAEYARIPSPNFFGLPKAEIELWLDVADVAFALGAERREPAP